MQPIVIHNRLVFGGLGVIFSLLFFALLAAVADAAPTDDNFPAEFSLPVGHHALFSAPASGDEVFQCVATSAGYAWQLRGVDAKLLDVDGHLFATQNDVGSWLAIDGSSLSGNVTQSVGAASGAFGAALYQVTTKSPGGVFSQISEVIRDDVSGGQAPAQACDQNSARTSVRVPFKADYIFFAPES